MADACTIYCRRANYREIYDAVASNTSCHIELEGSEGQWRKLTVRSEAGTLTVTALVYTSGGDPFSRLLLSTSAFCARVQGLEGNAESGVVSHIENCELILGVAADPEFSDEDGHFDCVWAICAVADGLVFNGSQMLDCNGRVLLDSTSHDER